MFEQLFIFFADSQKAVLRVTNANANEQENFLLSLFRYESIFFVNLSVIVCVATQVALDVSLIVLMFRRTLSSRY